MEKYYCDCVNFIVNARECREVVGSTMISFEVDNGNTDQYFTNNLLEVQLGISGIEVAQDSMIKERLCADWLIYTCLNCQKDAYCMHASKGVERVLIPLDLKHGEEFLKAVKESSTYSDIFKLKLGKFDADVGNKAIHLSAKNVSSISSKINKLTEKLLKSEEEAMEERLRLFKETEELQYRELKMKTNQQREQLIRTVKQYESNKMDSLFDSFNESYFGDPKQEERDMSTELPQFKGRGIPIKSSLSSALDYSQMAQSLPTSTLMSPTNKNRSKLSKRKTNFSSSRHRSYSESDDTMFDIEGFQEDKSCVPFYESDDDSSGDATSLESSGGFSIPTSRGLNPGDRVYATSVPVTIPPLFENFKNSYAPESDDEVQSPSPNHIADSIKALAKSMQDSTSMFGELPRPRINTLR